MSKESRDVPQERFREQVAERYRSLSAEADEALARLSAMPGAPRRLVSKEVDHLEGARELMSSQVVALGRAGNDQFGILRHDIERVTAEFEQSVERLRAMANEVEGRHVRSGRRTAPERSEAPPHPEPGDLKR